MRPGDTEAEISLFGPGYGESIAIHLGFGDWIIVDSCLDKGTKKPSALRYLQELGVDVSTRVKLVVATHWHDDHIRGLNTIFEACASAQFVMSNALRSGEFSQLVAAYVKSGMESSGVTTFSKIFDCGRARKGSAGVPVELFQFASSRKTLLSKAADTTTPGFSVTALSPSDDLFMASLAALSPTPGKNKRRIASPTPNEAAVVLWVQLGQRHLLLGADLENGNSESEGWRLLVNQPHEKKGAQVFKIPHHGSANGHNENVWEKMVLKDAHALITPYLRQHVPLPTPPDVERIREYTANISISRPAESRKVRVPLRGAKNRMILAVARNYQPVELATGQVRLRADMNSATDWAVEYIGTAQKL